MAVSADKAAIVGRHAGKPCLRPCDYLATHALGALPDALGVGVAPFRHRVRVALVRDALAARAGSRVALANVTGNGTGKSCSIARHAEFARRLSAYQHSGRKRLPGANRARRPGRVYG
jgi:hypothetical protein